MLKYADIVDAPVGKLKTAADDWSKWRASWKSSPPRPPTE